MKLEKAKVFWKKLLQEVSGTGIGSQITIQNETVNFNLDCKAGFYDDMPEEEYQSVLADMKELSALYDNKPTMAADTLLLRAIHATELTPLDIGKLASVLAHASERVDYAKSFKRFDAEPEGSLHSVGISTPQEIYDQLSRDVYGQDEAKKAISMLAWHHLNGRASSLLLAGPTGSGKSALIEALEKVPGIEVRTLDGSRLQPDGYRGSVHLSDVFPEADSDRNFIIFIDEFDKPATEPHFGSRGTNYNNLIMNQLLLLLDHKPLTFNGENRQDYAYSIDTSHISVILAGAFETLLKGKDSSSGGIGFGAETKKVHNYNNTRLTPEDFVRAGVRREIMGRITNIAMLRPMTTADFRTILDTPNISPIDRLSAEYGVQISVSAELKDELAEMAFTSGLGCRAVYSDLKRRLNDMMFADCTQNAYFLGNVSNAAGLPAYAYAEEY